MMPKLSFKSAVSLVPLMALLTCAASQGVTFHVLEEERVRTTVGNVIDGAKLYDIYSADVLSQLHFRFRDNDPLFEIVDSTGVIRTRRVLDREALPDCMYSTQCTFEREVIITPYAHFRVVPITIYVDDINDNEPEFPQPRVPLEIPESTAVNTTYPLAVAEDPDSEPLGIVRYELMTQTPDFGIMVNTLPDGSKDLRLVVLRKLDSETKNYYSLEIRAIDGGEPPKFGVVSVDITIGDSNDNSPMFDQKEYVVYIYENLEENTPVKQVSAQDMDEGNNGRVHFEFDHYTKENFGSIFGIHNSSGLVYVKGNVDYETHKIFHLTVIAKDLGGTSPSDSAKIIVHVIDVNDNPPVISVNTFTDNEYAKVPENVPAGHTVAYVRLSDPDTGAGGNITCGIDNGYFQIQGSMNSGSTGFAIVSAQSFDREQQEEYSLLIHCQDQGSPQLSSSVTIPIQVTDKNDNSPQFVPNTALFSISIPENNKIGDPIMKVNATDQDAMENAAIRYTIEPVNETPDDAVSIDLITGIIRANIEFDFERRDFYQYKIMATDQGSPARSVDTMLNLNILDVNDGVPHFIQSSYSFNVLENQVAKTSVGQVAAVDNDAPPFNHIVYTLQPGHDSYKFHIDPDTGVITTATIIDREESPLYQLTCIASNHDAPDIKAEVNITIHIDDINDNPPLMLYPNDNNNTIQVPTRMDIGYHVIQIEAVDPDDLENGQLRYDISSGNEGGIFKIDPDTGAISAAASTTMPNLKKQMLVLKVKDRGDPEKVTFAMLNVVFNSSVSVTQGMMTGNKLTLLIVAAVGGCAFIVIVISIAICCVMRRKEKKSQKEHVYNCRAEEMKKAMANGGDRVDSKRGDASKDKCIDTGISKTKEKSKKEVTFSVDMDQGWPAQSEKAVIENPNAQHIDPADCRPPNHLDKEIPRHNADSPDGESQEILPRNGGRPVSRQPSCCTCTKHDGRQMPPLTQQNLDMLEYWHNSVDRDSESGCSGTDSGRGPSEEGECGHAHGGGDGTNHHVHEHCGHGNCCCSSGIYAKRYHQPHLHPNMYNYPPAPRGCHCCGPAAHTHVPPSCVGHNCGSTCGANDLNKSNVSHEYGADECTPLEALPPFGRHHFRDRMYGPRIPRYHSDCRIAARPRLALDPDEMAKHRQYAPSLPSLADRHTPSPTFTSTSDSQFYPYTGAHARQAPGYKGHAFVPVKRSPSGIDDRSVSDDGTGTTMSGSYSMDNIKEEQPMSHKEIRLQGKSGDCYV